MPNKTSPPQSHRMDMERYQVTTDKESGIWYDPNDWAAEVGNPTELFFVKDFKSP
ncbi:MAG: hypothetical protein NT004_09765 [Bacteroidetes bacterium]|nr:hypothetical protein [Bacteroidota bacterium]